MASDNHSMKGAVFATVVILKSVADMYESMGLSIAAAHISAAVDVALRSAEVDPENLSGFAPPLSDQSQWLGSLPR